MTAAAERCMADAAYCRMMRQLCQPGTTEHAIYARAEGEHLEDAMDYEMRIARAVERQDDAALARMDAISEARVTLEERLSASLDKVWPAVLKALKCPAEGSPLSHTSPVSAELERMRERMVSAAADHLQSDF